MLEVRDLPTVNAALNAVSTVLLLTGWQLILRRKVAAHRVAMLSAFACSILFLGLYLYYHAQVGSVWFQGTGIARTVYLTILATHTVLAALVPFLALTTLWRAFQKRFDRHRRIARFTLPIWLYVSVTGVVVYWMLYRMTWS